MPRLPWIGRALLRFSRLGNRRSDVELDLRELFDARAGHSVRNARRRYVADAFSVWRRGLFPPRRAASDASSSASDLMTGLWLDLRHVARHLRASRTFTLIAVLSLGLGIGANVAIFSVIRTLLLAPMATRAPEQLALVYWHHPGAPRYSGYGTSGGRDAATGLSINSNISYPLYEALLRTRPEGVDAFGFSFMREVTLGLPSQPALLVGGLSVDDGYFRVLGPQMALGRGIGPDDNRTGAAPVVVLSHSLFLRQFGGETSVLGQTVRVNAVPAVVIGVTAPEFRGLSKGGFFPQTDVTVPLHLFARMHPDWAGGASLFTSDERYWLRVMARFPEDRLREAAAARWSVEMAPRMAPLLTKDEGAPRVLLQDGSRGLDQTGPETRRLLYVLMGVVGVVLLVACVNLASMMLARGVARHREIAVRRALGAGRFRLVRAQLLEALVLAFAGGIAGVLLTFWSRRVLTNLLTAGLGTAPLTRTPLEVIVDLPLILATFGLCVVVAVCFSLLPALRLTRGDSTSGLRTAVIGEPSSKLRLGRGLVALQIGMSVPLLVCAVLFLRTIANLGGVNLGFDPAGLVYFKVNPEATGQPARAHAGLYLQAIEQVRRVSGVTAVTLVENALLSGMVSNTQVTISGDKRSWHMNAIGPGYLETLGVRLLAGRVPGGQDGPGAPLVAAINETAARQAFGAESPLGRVMVVGSRSIEIVGVVSDTRYDSPRSEVPPTFFDSALQRAGYRGHHIVARATLPVAQLEPALKEAMAAVDRELPAPEITSQISRLQQTTNRERVFAQLLTLFGVFALLLSSIGLHGVTSYSVERRAREIGVRMALGAAPGQVLWMVQRQVAVLALIGLALGLPAALWTAPLLGALLFGVAPTDPGVLATGAAVMLMVAMTAGWFPARRAATSDPLQALRKE